MNPKSSRIALKNRTYQWQGKNHQGQWMRGEISALSLNLAKINLQKKGIEIFDLKSKKKIYLQKKITSLEILIFFRQLATLILAGISIAQALHILSQQTKHPAFVTLLTTIKEQIMAGNGLADSLRKFSIYFDDMTCSLILAGEKSGTLDRMLERIAYHKENVFSLQNKIKQALFYPCLILLVAALVTIIMLLFVVPRFTALFETTHAKLPAFTHFVIQLAHCLQQSWLFVLLIFVLLGIGLYSAKHYPRLKFYSDYLLLKLPLLGASLQKFILTGWAHSLSTLFTAGIPITEALKILTPSTGNSLYQHAIHHLYLDISAGKQLHTAMQNNPLFPTLLTQMVQIGEESGTLDKMLSKTADFYEADLDHLISQLNRLLEPLIMIILGVVIGGLVIAMYLPIFKLGAVI